MDSLRDGPGNIGTGQLRHGETLLFLLSVALLGNIVGGLAVLPVGQPALLPLDGLLDWLLGDAAPSLLDISTCLVRDSSALPLGDRLVGGVGHILALLDWLVLALLGWHLLLDSPGHLVAHLLRNLAAHGLWSLPHHRRGVSLVGQAREGEEDGDCCQSLHVGALTRERLTSNENHSHIIDRFH